MATARDLLKIVLRYVGEETNFSIAPDESYGIALNKLNEYIESLRANGLRLNASQTELTNLNSIVNFPAWARPAIEYNVAVMSWMAFNPGVPIDPILLKQAQDKESEMFNLHGAKVKSVFPSTLPQGTGNRDGFWGRYDKFYPPCDDNIYACDPDQLETETGIPLKSEGA